MSTYHRRNKADWLKVITQFKQSGLSKKHFCQQQNIPPSNFYRIQALYAPELLHRGGKMAHHAINKFVPIINTTNIQPSSARQEKLCLMFSSGIKLEFSLGCATDYLKAVIMEIAQL